MAMSDVFDFFVEEDSEPSVAESPAGGTVTDEGGRPVMDEGGRPVRMEG